MKSWGGVANEYSFGHRVWYDVTNDFSLEERSYTPADLNYQELVITNEGLHVFGNPDEGALYVFGSPGLEGFNLELEEVEFPN